MIFVMHMLHILVALENVPSKLPIPLNILSNTLYIFYVSFSLFLLSISRFGDDRK